MHEVRLKNTARRFGLSSHVTPDLLMAYTAALIEHGTPVSGADELLTTLRNHGVRSAIVTNAYDGAEQRARIGHCFPDVRFDVIVAEGECRAPKPNRAPFDTLLARLDEAPEDGAYVGDNPHYDVPGAVAAGIQTFIVSPNQQARERAHELGGTEYPSLEDLPLRAAASRAPTAEPAPGAADEGVITSSAV